MVTARSEVGGAGAGAGATDGGGSRHGHEQLALAEDGQDEEVESSPSVSQVSLLEDSVDKDQDDTEQSVLDAEDEHDEDAKSPSTCPRPSIAASLVLRRLPASMSITHRWLEARRLREGAGAPVAQEAFRGPAEARNAALRRRKMAEQENPGSFGAGARGEGAERLAVFPGDGNEQGAAAAAAAGSGPLKQRSHGLKES